MSSRLVFLAVLAAACGGGASGVQPDTGPAQAVDQFMRAVSDSNLTRMAELWGTGEGPAARTRKPDDYERRLAIMHAFLKGSESRVLSQIERAGNRVVLAVELVRRDCRHQVPFTVVRLGDGSWIVNAVDLTAMGTPGRPCPPEDGDRR